MWLTEHKAVLVLCNRHVLYRFMAYDSVVFISWRGCGLYLSVLSQRLEYDSHAYSIQCLNGNSIDEEEQIVNFERRT